MRSKHQPLESGITLDHVRAFAETLIDSPFDELLLLGALLVWVLCTPRQGSVYLRHHEQPNASARYLVNRPQGGLPAELRRRGLDDLDWH